MTDKSHNFLAEELLSPNANKSDTMRLNMFNNHLAQALILDQPDFPQIFTNFENQVGQYSTSYKAFDEDYEILRVFRKNKYKAVFILINKKKKKIAILEDQKAVNITESYGYKIISHMEDKKAGDRVKKGETAWRSTSFDEQMNYSFGKNLKTMYLSKEHKNFEDSIVISESAAKKLANNAVSVVEVNLNPNDIMLNIYGDKETYKTFPKIGDTVKDGEICAVRRFRYDSFLYDLQNNNLQRPAYNGSDLIFHGTGTVVDIDVYSNESLEDSANDMYNSQLRLVQESQHTYYSEMNIYMKGLLEKYSKYEFSDDFMFLYGRSNAFIGQQPWAKGYKEFSGTIIQFTVLHSMNLQYGDKITNRYGGKGIIGEITTIREDSKMPVMEDGSGRAEVVLSPFGVIARTNPAQLFELHLTFYADNIMDMMRDIFLDDDMADTDAVDKLSALYFDFLEIVSPPQHLFLTEKFNELDFIEEQIEFYTNLLEDDFLYIHQAPFFGNADFNALVKLRKRFPTVVPYEFEGIQTPLIMGNMYFMKLKHYAFSKFSARSAATLNQMNIPNKSQNFKNDISRYSKTPIRMGEMETFNLMLLNNSDLLSKFNKAYSSSSEERRNMIKILLSSKDPLNIKEIELLDPDGKDNIQEIITEYFKALGIRLVK